MLCIQSLDDASWTTDVQGNEAVPYQNTYFYIALIECYKVTIIRDTTAALTAYKLQADMQKMTMQLWKKGYFIK